jgi:hypothetical protein
MSQLPQMNSVPDVSLKDIECRNGSILFCIVVLGGTMQVALRGFPNESPFQIIP